MWRSMSQPLALPGQIAGSPLLARRGLVARARIQRYLQLLAARCLSNPAPSYLHRHSGISRAISRHLGRKARQRESALIRPYPHTGKQDAGAGNRRSLFRPRGRPSRTPLVLYMSEYHADSWTTPESNENSFEHDRERRRIPLSFGITSEVRPRRLAPAAKHPSP
jgi:hypothetical protein